MTEIERLEVEHRIAGAELGLIEELRSIIATLATFSMQAYLFHSWPISILAGIAIFFCAPYWHSKRYDETWNAVEKATRMSNSQLADDEVL